MAKWRTRPQVKEAGQWFPGKEVPGVFREDSVAIIGGRGHGPQTFAQAPRWYVVTIHGQRAYLSPGDYVVTEKDGLHHYPCKPDIWEAGHELIEG